jgi:cytochrome c biogenesis protein CcdA
MRPSSIFYEVTSKTAITIGRGFAAAFNHGIKPAFNWAAGNNALYKRGMTHESDRPNAEGDGTGFMLGVAGFLTGFGSGLTVALALAPVIGPLATIPALAAATTGCFTPARLHAAYKVGRYEKERRKQPLQKASPKRNISIR